MHTSHLLLSPKIQWDLAQRFGLLGAFLICSSFTAHAAIVNLTAITVDGVAPSAYLGTDGTTYRGGVINGAVFRSATVGSGSGGFRRLFQMQDSVGGNDGVESGYNRSIMESSTPGGFDPKLKVSDLVESTDGGYYLFALDANEGGKDNSLLSLDMLSIYVGTPTDPSPLPTTEASLSALGTRIYSFSATDHVLLDSSTSTGSGTSDMFAFIPKGLFAGFAGTRYVYLFAKHGSYNPDYKVHAGFEEWATGSAFLNAGAMVPEPSGCILAAGGAMLLMMIRRRA